jgi:hypothetical protein
MTCLLLAATRMSLFYLNRSKPMRNKRIIMTFIVIGLLAVLTLSVYASTSAHPTTPNIVGTWQMKIAPSETSPEGLEVLQTFFADGNYMETINIGASSTSHGVWMGAGNNYLYTFQVFSYDEQGNYSGTRTIHGTIRMDGPDHLIGNGSADIIDPEGKVTKNAFSAPWEATRMEVELPEMP